MTFGQALSRFSGPDREPMMADDFTSTQPCRFLNLDVQVTARTAPRDSREAFEGGQGQRVLDCLDKAEICYAHSCYFTTDGGEWPFSISRKKLEETFIHGGGI